MPCLKLGCLDGKVDRIKLTSLVPRNTAKTKRNSPTRIKIINLFQRFLSLKINKCYTYLLSKDLSIKRIIHNEVLTGRNKCIPLKSKQMHSSNKSTIFLRSDKIEIVNHQGLESDLTKTHFLRNNIFGLMRKQAWLSVSHTNLKLTP